MTTEIKEEQKEISLPDISPGDTVKVFQILKEITSKGEKKERIQVFEGQVLCCKHGKETGATVTVRKIIDGVGVEKIFPIHSPVIEKIEVLSHGKVRRAKLYYLRGFKGKKSKIKRKDINKAQVLEPADRLA